MTLQNPDGIRIEFPEIESTLEQISIQEKMAALEARLAEETKARENAERQLEAMKRKWRRDTEIYEILQKQMGAYSKPPQMPGFDIAAKVTPFYRFGGDAVSFIDFNNQFHLERRKEKARIRAEEGRGSFEVVEKLEELKNKFGIMLIDVEGHDNADISVAYAIQLATRLGIKYDLRANGNVTTKPFDYMHDILAYMRQQSRSRPKTVGITYAEVNTEGTIKIINGGMPWYSILRADTKLEQVSDQIKPAMAMGTRASKANIDITGSQTFGLEEYTIHEAQLNPGDTLLLYSDGYPECGIMGSKHRKEHQRQVLSDLEASLVASKGLSSAKRCERAYQDIITKYHPQRDEYEGDDMTLILVHRQ